MDPRLAKAVILIGCAVFLAIRISYGRRIGHTVETRGPVDPREVTLLSLVAVGFLVPLVWVTSSLLAMADVTLRPAPLALGAICLALGLLLFARSHADLGASWSPTLQVQEGQELVTAGVYRHVRHPMYSAFLLYSLGQALVVPNFVAGPFFAVAMVLFLAFRLSAEERVMLKHFGRDYEAYTERTKRLIPGVW